MQIMFDDDNKENDGNNIIFIILEVFLVKWELIERPLTINPKEFSIKKYRRDNAMIE